MADYAKKKNDDLIALCRERGLPHSGKKVDFVKRLEEYDQQHGGAAPTTSAAQPAIEDEIDWDDEPATVTAKAATSTQAADATVAGGIGEVKNPVAVPNQTLAEDPATTNDLAVTAAPEAATTDGEPAPVLKEASPEKDFSTGIAERTIDEEIEKRKARARKFGLPEDSDEIRMLERAKRFGVQDASAVPGMLNSALSEGRKREGRGEKRALDGALSADSGVRKRSRGDRRGGRGGLRRQPSGRPNGEKKEGGNGGANWMAEADRAKAEARKQRFTTG